MHDLKWASHVQGQKYQHAFSIHPWDPNFRLFCSTMSRFWVTAQFLEKCTKWPWHVQGQKYQHVCSVHPLPLSEAQIFVPFALRWAVLELHGFFAKVHRMTQNDLDMLKVKNTNIRATNTPETQISVRFAIRWAVSELWPNFRKSAPNDPKWSWHVPGQKYQHVCYIHPQRQNFQSVSLYNEPFLSCSLIFGENSHVV